VCPNEVTSALGVRSEEIVYASTLLKQLQNVISEPIGEALVRGIEVGLCSTSRRSQ